MYYIGKNGRRYTSASALGVGNSLYKMGQQDKKWQRFNKTLNSGEALMGVIQLSLGAYLISTNAWGAGILGLILIAGGVLSIVDFKNYKQPNDSLFAYISKQRKYGLSPSETATTEELNEWIECRQKQRSAGL